MNISTQREFTFGRNWRRFLHSYTPLRQKIARDCLLSFLQLPDLKGKSFLDIGSGSGIHSAAAYLAGAERVCSFDYDPDSVAATEQLRQHHGSPTNWEVSQGSVLDADFIQSLGKFDIVYAWGMLHHTGDQWQALRNAAIPLDLKGRLYIALYAKEAYPNWQYWLEVKKRYNQAGRLQKLFMEVTYVWQIFLGQKLSNILTMPKMILQYQNSRGMDFMTDVRDWLGGWPTEFSSVPEIINFSDKFLALAVVNLRVGEGNTEFLLVRMNQMENMGFTPIDLEEYTSNLPLLETLHSTKEPVWIFGTGRGGDLIFDYLSRRNFNIAGFIDIEPTRKSLHGLKVLTLETFIDQQPITIPVILANRYFKENSNALRKAGFAHFYNAHPILMKLLHNIPLTPDAA